MTEVLESQLLSPGVRQLDEPLVQRSHGNGDLTPSLPHLEQLVSVSHRCEAPLHRWKVEALLLAVRTELPLTVEALHLGHDFRQLLLQRRVRRRHRGERRLQANQLSRQVFGQVQVVESRRFGRQLGRGGHQCRVGGSRHRVGVVGDEVVLDPRRSPGLHPKLEETLFGMLHERPRVVDSGARRRRAPNEHDRHRADAHPSGVISRLHSRVPGL